MSCRLTRRDLLVSAAAASLSGLSFPGTARAGQTPGTASGLRKAVWAGMLPKDLSWRERFALARDVGFEGIEVPTRESAAEAAEVAEAQQATGLLVHSVMNEAHWRFPLSSNDSAVVGQSVKGMETSLRNAALWKSGCVLLVPAVVDAQTSYRDAWTRSARVIRERILPLAAELQVVIGVEEVWNKFLLSPIEFARYVDEFQSPWVKAYFDVGNIVFYAYPHDWIRTLGSRIVRLHLKDFKLERGAGRFEWKNLGEGDIDWLEVRRALGDIGYAGFLTTELAGGDRAYLADVARRVDRIFAGEKAVAGGGQGG